MRQGHKSPPNTKGRRRDRLIRERVHDPYKTRLKLTEPTVCPKCGAVWQSGRWTWQDHNPPKEAENIMCQACHRIADKYPAGELTIGGKFAKVHEQDIIGLIRNTEALESKNIHCTELWISKLRQMGFVSQRPISTCRDGSGKHCTMPTRASSILNTTRKVILSVSIGTATTSSLLINSVRSRASRN